jgi:hypothetical protein
VELGVSRCKHIGVGDVLGGFIVVRLDEVVQVVLSLILAVNRDKSCLGIILAVV